MSINANSRFTIAPTIKTERSKFPMGQKIMTTFNAGELVPLFTMEILPGDTISLTENLVCRMMTPLYPTMDIALLSTFAFYTPNRQLWDHWKEFMGENTTSPWYQSTQYVVPRITAPTGGITKGTVASHLGLPLGVAGITYSALPFRNYCHIYNNFFRDQNLIAPINFYTDDTDRTGDNSLPELGGALLKIAKKHDYFTSALPDTQKGPEIKMPLGISAPIYGNGKPLTFQYTTNATTATNALAGLGQTIAHNAGNPSITDIAIGDANKTNVIGDQAQGYTQFSNAHFNGIITKDYSKLLLGDFDSGMYADLQGATAASVSALRLNVAIQRLEEKGARFGTRYFEILKGQFNVDHVGNLVMMIPEFLGAQETPISMTQVNQNVADSNAPLGNTGAYSLTSDFNNKLFTKSFTEHGWIMILGAVRQAYHSYQKGINRMWSRRDLYDFYNPVFAHLSEQPIYNKEIYATATATDDQVFGYQERWAEYRYLPNIITDEVNSYYTTPLDQWHYGDKYGSLPTLSQTFIEETDAYIKRSLAVQNHDQFILDGYIQIVAQRCMPTYSVPGWTDHF